MDQISLIEPGLDPGVLTRRYLTQSTGKMQAVIRVNGSPDATLRLIRDDLTKGELLSNSVIACFLNNPVHKHIVLFNDMELVALGVRS